MTFPKQLDSVGHKDSQVIDQGKEEDRRRIGFMDLAVEIRLRIYDYVYDSHSVRHSKLPLWYLTQGSGRHVLKPVTSQAAIKPSPLPYEETPDGNDTISHAPTRELLSAHRPMNYIPTALLLACRQIYYEARTIPYYENEFVFPSWHDVDSVQAVRNFLNDRLCADWQRQSMRYVRIELDLSEDKSNSNKNGKAEAWEELLCSATNWGAGLRGMRLCIDCKEKDLIKGSFAAVLDGAERAGLGDQSGPEEEEPSSFAWIFRGLLQLRSLRKLDVEIKRGRRNMTDDEKVGWCRLLEELLNMNCERDEEEEEEERGRDQKVSVMCAQTSYNPFDLEQVFGKISYPMMMWPLYAGV
ncbi:hypothetical protein N0V85_001351 [Neurospora sp. IMI 360204]|nr:hypothetical protein N0V85_001351 [Neurospora sp. IMI 360204]